MHHIVAPEAFSAKLPAYDAIGRIAGENSLDIDAARKQRLQDMGQLLHGSTLEAEAKCGDEIYYDEFSYAGLDISLVCRYPRSSRHPDANIDFLPSYDEPRKAFPMVGHATPIILDAITSLQDYCLLVEAGFIRQPRLLKGNTNPRMARIAQRAGFIIVTEDNEEGGIDPTVIEAPYTNLKCAIFSEDTRNTVELLRRRLSRKSRPDADVS